MDTTPNELPFHPYICLSLSFYFLIPLIPPFFFPCFLSTFCSLSLPRPLLPAHFSFARTRRRRSAAVKNLKPGNSQSYAGEKRNRYRIARTICLFVLKRRNFTALGVCARIPLDLFLKIGEKESPPRPKVKIPRDLFPRGFPRFSIPAGRKNPAA